MTKTKVAYRFIFISHKMPSITIVNRHYPPNPGITGESAWDLANYLIEKHGFEVRVVHVERNDLGGGQLRQPVGETFAVPTIYKGKNGILKLVAGFFDGFFLILKTRRVRKGVVICLTSPPLLPLWAGWLLGKRWVLWSMDLFPEGFAADGLIKTNNPVYGLVRWLAYRRAPTALIALGPNQAAQVQQNYGQKLPTIVLPCGVLLNQPRDAAQPDWRKNNGKIYFGYCGNLGDAHSADFLRLFIQHFDSERHHLVLAIYGTKASEVLLLAEKRAGISILKNVPRSQLHFIDVHLVSLLTKWTHIAVPSKAMSSICAGGAVLFCGSQEADTWVLLQEASWLVAEQGDLETQLSLFLNQITPQAVDQKKATAQQVAQRLRAQVVTAYEAIAQLDGSPLNV